jgi:hypothetical protein
MSKTPKRPKDPNQLAKMMIDIGSGEIQNDNDSELSPMAALGRVGGQKGGKARAENLSAERRAEIAQKAAAARWQTDGG